MTKYSGFTASVSAIRNPDSFSSGASWSWLPPPKKLITSSSILEEPGAAVEDFAEVDVTVDDFVGIDEVVASVLLLHGFVVVVVLVAVVVLVVDVSTSSSEASSLPSEEEMSEDTDVTMEIIVDADIGDSLEDETTSSFLLK